MTRTEIVNLIRTSLEKKTAYEDLDQFLLNELVFNLQMAEECRKNILEEGIRINITQNKKKTPYYIKNQSYNIYLSLIKTITSILADLGLTPRERAKIKQIIQEEDAFENLSKYDE